MPRTRTTYLNKKRMKQFSNQKVRAKERIQAPIQHQEKRQCGLLKTNLPLRLNSKHWIRARTKTADHLNRRLISRNSVCSVRFLYQIVANRTALALNSRLSYGLEYCLFRNKSNAEKIQSQLFIENKMRQNWILLDYGTFSWIVSLHQFSFN